MKTIIAGGRDYYDYRYLERVCLEHEITEVVSGAARGTDRLGERYAKAYGITLKSFPADWDSWGKAAGHIRNSQMADYAEALIAFWDGKSRGTKNMIETARKKGLEVRVVMYEPIQGK